MAQVQLIAALAQPAQRPIVQGHTQYGAAAQQPQQPQSQKSGKRQIQTIGQLLCAGDGEEQGPKAQNQQQPWQSSAGKTLPLPALSQTQHGAQQQGPDSGVAAVVDRGGVTFRYIAQLHDYKRGQGQRPRQQQPGASLATSPDVQGEQQGPYQVELHLNGQRPGMGERGGAACPVKIGDVLPQLPEVVIAQENRKDLTLLQPQQARLDQPGQANPASQGKDQGRIDPPGPA